MRSEQAEPAAFEILNKDQKAALRYPGVSQPRDMNARRRGAVGRQDQTFRRHETMALPMDGPNAGEGGIPA